MEKDNSLPPIKYSGVGIDIYESEVLSMEKLVYTVQETAQILNIGLNKAYELIQEKQIPNLRVGRKILIPKLALESWLVKSADKKIVGE